MSKQEWLERLAFKREELLMSVEGLSQIGWTMDEVLPGWTAKDVLAHIAAWETRVATYLPDLLADSGRRWNGGPVGVEADTFNAEQVALRRERTPRELLQELADSRRRILEALTTVNDDGLTQPHAVPWGQVTIERWALQEIYEHDGEHAAQLRAWRAEHPESGRSLWDVLVDDMAAQRAGLLMACLGLDANTLVSAPVMSEWTVKDVLAHVAAWDDIHATRAELALAGREAEIVGVEVDERNAELFAQRRGWSLEQTVQATTDSRQHFLKIVNAANAEQLVRPVHLPWRETSIWEFARWRAWHDAVHTEPTCAWRDANSSPCSRGPRSVLLAAMDAARRDLLRQIDRIPLSERDTRPIMGDWTLKDMLGHIVDWDLYALKALRAIREFRPLPYVAESDVDKVNAQQVAARREQTWDQAWADFQDIRAKVINALADWYDEQLARAVDYPSDWGRTAYGWFVSQTAWHDREHADAMRAL
jgi:uncharacterized damage-inducible protein DinB